jgi:hypothetical protein
LKYNIRLHSPKDGGWIIQSEDKKIYIFCSEIIIDKPTKTELYKDNTGKILQGALTVNLEENQELKIINNILYIK